MKVISLDGGDTGKCVICKGHVDPLQFANRVDTDDVVDLLGDGCKLKGSYPTDASVRRLAKQVRHSWGIWRAVPRKKDSRWWEEVPKGEPGAAPFTVVDQG